MRNAKIVCTLGPATEDRRTIRGLADAGMSVARLNASHGSVEDRAELIDIVREIDDGSEKPVAAMLDTQGPEVRTAPLKESIHLESGSQIRFVEGQQATPEEVGLSVGIDAAAPGDRVLLDDGRIETVVEERDGEAVIARVESGGPLAGRKGVNVPGVELDLDVVTEKDRQDLRLAAEKEVDFVAASFVRDAEDIYEVEAAVETFGESIPIISKIERAGAVENLEEIIDASYGVMVARGDLGVECPMEDVPMIQKRIIRNCRDAGVPVITATEMLDSMVHSRRPTRAEASDVANAVLDGTDGVMLSGETAIGDHPIRVVETMDSIVREVERSEEYAELREGRVPAPSDSRTEALARAARYLARDLDASAVVAASESGYTARKMAKYRPGVPIIASTPTQRVRRQLALSWGVNAEYVPFSDEGTNDVIENAVGAALDSGVAESGDTVIVLSGMMSEIEGAGTTNMLKVHVAAETIETGTGVVSGRTSGPLVASSSGELSGIEPGAIVTLASDFDGEFSGDLSSVGAIIDARSGMTGYPAMIARELGIPMISGADLTAVPDGTVVTVDAERGVIYEGELASPSERRETDFSRRPNTE
ncbi:MAG: pyruvate kinase [Euryarchaeota archaeon]|nr:pyruvate kinase [Euryarchaeota archaeon]